MSLSLVRSRALVGLAAERVTVEVHLANGLPSFTLVGLAETEVKEALVLRNVVPSARPGICGLRGAASVGADDKVPKIRARRAHG